ncbi:hypothetical protein [Rhabdothermincola sediminis]|uniref:hypothetical protein n=1 Tax=Rhabdothermincola sediminis TaxID=2751370 RepID=UPI001AA055AB|nr:hypothetical protein [Rhabdothermincola sediminis]
MPASPLPDTTDWTFEVSDWPNHREDPLMNAFEDLVARLLRREGYWTRQSSRTTR